MPITIDLLKGDYEDYALGYHWNPLDSPLL